MQDALAETWYATLQKPWFAPPAWVFGPVWSVLYALIILSFGYVFYCTLSGRWPRRVAIPFAINLIANLLFSPLQFRLQNTLLATVDILIILLSLLWAMRTAWPHARWVAYLQIPYLLWVSFATVLQVTIAGMNG